MVEIAGVAFGTGVRVGTGQGFVGPGVQDVCVILRQFVILGRFGFLEDLDFWKFWILGKCVIFGIISYWDGAGFCRSRGPARLCYFQTICYFGKIWFLGKCGILGQFVILGIICYPFFNDFWAGFCRSRGPVRL